MHRHFDKCLDLGGLFFIPQFEAKAHRREKVAHAMGSWAFIYNLTENRGKSAGTQIYVGNIVC